MKFIELNHPVNPITKNKFNLAERVGVRNLGWRLLDMCAFHYIISSFRWCFKKYQKFSRGKKLFKTKNSEEA